MRTRMIVGCMTGTSIDGLDAALVRIEGEGLGMRATFVRGVSEPLGELAPRLRGLAEQKPVTAGEIAVLARDFALLHARAAKTLLREDRCDLICAHGQTVFHAPPVSWQLFQPAPLAHALGCPVVCDLRQADLAAGGQGAPITPIADGVLFARARTGAGAIVNLGGFCNVTLLCADGVRTAMDVCACNQVLDGAARAGLGRAYDADGAAARRGRAHEGASRELAGLLLAQRAQRRSLGTGDEALGWCSTWNERLSGDDLCASACAGVAGAIGAALADAGCDGPLLVAGGGAHNGALLERLRGAWGLGVKTTTDAGVPVEHRESACFAVLGALAQDRVPITLPGVTGCAVPAPIAGAWVYG